MSCAADILERPRIGQTYRVNVDEFRRRAVADGWAVPLIEAFTQPPHDGWARAYVGGCWLCIEPTPRDPMCR